MNTTTTTEKIVDSQVTVTSQSYADEITLVAVSVFFMVAIISLLFITIRNS